MLLVSLWRNIGDCIKIGILTFGGKWLRNVEIYRFYAFEFQDLNLTVE
jgi:hypothetical protein